MLTIHQADTSQVDELLASAVRPDGKVVEIWNRGEAFTAELFNVEAQDWEIVAPRSSYDEAVAAAEEILSRTEG